MLASTAMNKDKPLVTKTSSFLMLPNDLLFNCLARVSRSYYPTLALVSKTLRSLLASLELYDNRTLLGHTENCLYVCLFFPRESNHTRWFTLCRRPIQITDPNPSPNPRWLSPCFVPYRFVKNCTRKKQEKIDENCFVSVPTRGSPDVNWWGIIAVGHKIYKFGGRVNYSCSFKVFFMDCRSHTWHEAPSMKVGRETPRVSVLDGKIYVAGGNKHCDSSNWIEVFDPKTHVWEHVLSPDAEIRKSLILESFSMEGKLYMFGYRSSVVYKPKENRWEEVGFEEMAPVFFRYPSCIIDNVLYWYGSPRKLEWYDFEVRSWRLVKGLEKLPKLPKGYCCVRLVDYGGNIAVLWEKDVLMEKKIWCAEISLERRSGDEIHGKIEWCNVVLTVPKSCQLMQFLAVVV